MEKYCLSTTKQLFIAYRTFFNTGVSKILFSFLCQRKKTILKECMEMIFFCMLKEMNFFLSNCFLISSLAQKKKFIYYGRVWMQSCVVKKCTSSSRTTEILLMRYFVLFCFLFVFFV